MLLEQIRCEPLDELSFEPINVAGLDALVARGIDYERAVDLWRAAHAACGSSWSAVLTDDNYVHEDLQEIKFEPPPTLAAVRRERTRVVSADEEASDALRQLARAMPQAEAYEERDTFVEEDLVSVSLVVVNRPSPEAVCPFTPDGEGTCPRQPELLMMLRRWNLKYGVTPLYADGDVMELDVPRPPSDIKELRTLARDFFLLSQGNFEGVGIEDPSRLLRRLTANRWVLWWYGTT